MVKGLELLFQPLSATAILLHSQCLLRVERGHEVEQIGRRTADIISVEFPNPQTGKLATSANETWTTTDAGLTWHRN